MTDTAGTRAALSGQCTQCTEVLPSVLALGRHIRRMHRTPIPSAKTATYVGTNTFQRASRTTCSPSMILSMTRQHYYFPKSRRYYQRAGSLGRRHALCCDCALESSQRWAWRRRCTIRKLNPQTAIRSVPANRTVLHNSRMHTVLQRIFRVRVRY
eukprot:IDg5461t1